jgi:hypothetical protein
MKISKYVEFIKEARSRGFGDLVIRNALLEKGWPLNEINIAFNYISTMRDEEDEFEEYKSKNQITIFLEDDLLELLVKRARKNLLTLPELVEDILRRSTINQKGKKALINEKLDDRLVGLFSRKRTGPKHKRKHKKKVHRKKKHKEEKKKHSK